MGKFRDGMPVTARSRNAHSATLDRVKTILEALETQRAGTGGRRRRSHRPSLSGLARSDDAAPAVGSVHEREPAPARGKERLPQTVATPTIAAAAKSGAVSRARRSQRQALEPFDPRQRRYARSSDDHGLGAGAHAQPASRDRAPHEDSDFKVPLQRLSNVTAELQEGVMKTRMQPIGNAWQKLPRMVRDLAAELGKDIELRHARRRDRARSSGARTGQRSAHPSGAQLRRPRHREPGRADRRRQTAKPARSSSAPVIKAVTSSLRSPTTAAASTSPASNAKPSRPGLPPKPKSRRNPTAKSAISFSRPASPPRPGHEHFRPWRRHGRRP